ncbi:MAG: hypothetical protein ACR2FS_02065, partial [Phormidesmis sp.]
PQYQAAWESYCQTHLPDLQQIGSVRAASAPLTIQKGDSETLISLAVADLDDAWSHAIERALAKSSS